MQGSLHFDIPMSLVSEVRIYLAMHTGLSELIASDPYFWNATIQTLRSNHSGGERTFSAAACRTDLETCFECGSVVNTFDLYDFSSNGTLSDTDVSWEQIKCGNETMDGSEANEIIVTITNHTMGQLAPCEIAIFGKSKIFNLMCNVKSFQWVKHLMFFN